MLSDVQRAYIAGIIDGEGCISIGRTPGVRYPFHKVCVGVSMVNPYVPTLLHSFYGGSLTKIDKRGDNWREQTSWRAYGRDAYGCLKSVLPFLAIKRREARLALRFFREHSTILGKKKVKKLTHEIWEKREGYKRLLSRLKVEV